MPRTATEYRLLDLLIKVEKSLWKQTGASIYVLTDVDGSAEALLTEIRTTIQEVEADASWLPSIE